MRNSKINLQRKFLLSLWIRNSADEKFLSLTSISATNLRSSSVGVLKSCLRACDNPIFYIYIYKMIFSNLMHIPSIFLDASADTCKTLHSSGFCHLCLSKHHSQPEQFGIPLNEIIFLLKKKKVSSFEM